MRRTLALRGPLVETALALAVLAGLVRCAIYLWQNSYLPPPFFYEPDDTFADWFNTAFWARDPGTYDVWYTVYPPLSFIIIRLVGIDSCYPDRRSYDFSAGLAARDCDWIGLTAIGLLFVINTWLVWRLFCRCDRKTAVPRTICMALGLPMLDVIERGNLALLAFTFLLLGLAPLLRSARLKWLMIAMAINLKVYLIAAIAPLILKRRWRWTEGALLASVIVYLASLAMFGRGTPGEIADNIGHMAQNEATVILSQWYTTTYQPLLSLVTEGRFPLTLIIGSYWVDVLGVALPLLQHTVQLGILAAFAATALRPERVPAYRLVNLGILMALITSEAGGYSMIYFTLFTLLEPWNGSGRRLAIVACYILAIPLDIALDTAVPMVRNTYFGDRQTIITYIVTAGPFVRPLIILTIAAALSAVTIRAVWTDVREQGWSKRWRFRHDAPLLPWLARPTPPCS